MADRFCITIAWINTSIIFLLLEDPLVDIVIIDRIIRYLKYNKPLIPIT
jgi:hypothetical protein